MVVHHNATSVTMEVDPPRNANSPDDPKTANGSLENEKADDSESSEDVGPLDVGEHYLVRRYDGTWREYRLNKKIHLLLRKTRKSVFFRGTDPAGAQRDFCVCVSVVRRVPAGAQHDGGGVCVCVCVYI